MNQVPRGRTLLVAAAVVATLGAIAPSPQHVLRPARTLDLPLDQALRVPFGAAFFTDIKRDVQPGDRVLDVTLADGSLQMPRNRAELGPVVDRLPVGSQLRVHVIRDRDARETIARVIEQAPWRRLMVEWPFLLAATLFLSFGVAVAIGSQHPVSLPLFSTSWCIAVAILSDIDLLLPGDPGLLGIPELRPRLGAFALALLPGAVLHLSMRFPIVAARFSAPSAAAAPYIACLIPAAFAQARFEDSALLASVERIVIGLSFSCAAVLVIASATRASQMTPIERARTRALTVGVALGLALPFAAFASRNAPLVWGRTPIVLSLLAIPVCISWAIARYRLLDPTAWLRQVVALSAQALASLLLAGAAVGQIESLSDGVLASDTLVPTGLLTVAIYEGARMAMRRAAAWRGTRADPREMLAAATRLLAVPRARAGVLEAINETIASTLRPAATALIDLHKLERALPALARSGVDLWRTAGGPLHEIVVRRVRSEDPSPASAEVVAPIKPESTGAVLLVLSARRDGLPYEPEVHAALHGLAHIAATALDACATTEDLERRVAEKTASLGRSVSARERVLVAAEEISRVDSPDQVLDTISRFAESEGASAAWNFAESDGSWVVEISRAPRRVAALKVGGLTQERREEVAPHLATLCAFGGLALARLELLSELKREVERQAVEIAESRSRRLHAEFVRDVAHELRKPTEESRRLLEELAERDEQTVEGSPLARLRSVTQELGRRLDLLLFHSGVRIDRQKLDLVRLAGDAMSSARTLWPDRDFTLSSAVPRLPLVADSARLLSVLENLLDNAAKASAPRQQVVTRCSIEHRGPEGPWVVIEVEDQGRGIDPDHLDHVFEPGVTFSPQGFGLGLSLCREIIRLHGGSIGAESRPGSTIFRVAVPQIPRVAEEVVV